MSYELRTVIKNLRMAGLSSDLIQLMPPRSVLIFFEGEALVRRYRSRITLRAEEQLRVHFCAVATYRTPASATNVACRQFLVVKTHAWRWDSCNACWTSKLWRHPCWSYDFDARNRFQVWPFFWNSRRGN